MSFRICATVLQDFNGRALQSYNFQTKRVLGGIKNVLFFLNAYKIDEIHLIVPLKGRGLDTSEILKELKDVPISTPLSIGGGINVESLTELIKDPYFERLIFNSPIFDDNQVIRKATLKMGRQAILGYIPFILKKNTIKIYHSKINEFIEVSDKFWKNLNSMCNEIILLDADAEGSKKGFNFKALQFVNFPVDRVLISGGLTKLDINKAKEMKLAGVSLDNSTLHSEFSIKGLR
jgi:phosphoribosylformimino-5-aminoimidazole carboxamide ribonucleotide (ProFAR) isomerase